jgi:3,4-dihydroxy-2-butanone 4-phosphate synthase
VAAWDAEAESETDVICAGARLRPGGHVYPLRAWPGLLAGRTGHIEATVALCTAAPAPGGRVLRGDEP